MTPKASSIHANEHVPVPPLGERLDYLRKREKLTRDELAKRLNALGWRECTGIMLYKISAGLRPATIHEAALLARALDCSIGYLMGETDRRRKNKPRK